MENTQDIGAMVTQLNDTLALVLERLDNQQQMIDELDNVLYSGLIGPINDQMAQQEYDTALSDFRCKYAEQLGPFEDVVRAIDDEDVYQKAFDAYNEGGFEASPDEYVAQLAESLKEQVAAVKAAVEEKTGVEPDIEATVEAETPDGKEVEVKTDGDEVETEDEHSEEAVTEEEKVEDEPTGESLEDFEASLRKELDNEKGPLIKQ